ncbi:hypothetical protein ACFFIO_15565 [Citricoccus parietis]|uniref:DUF4157 domain-containing protein n=1 Tax=Citricoccus parietis TaxID=592307 RepID=A0ABV6F8Q5_9MICC
MARTTRWLLLSLAALGVVFLPAFATPPVAAGPPQVTLGGTADRAEVDRASAAGRVRQLMSPWCTDVPTSVHAGSGGQAGYTVDWHPLSGRSEDPSVFIKVGLQWPTDHAGTRAVALHECAHILQYRAYGFDADALASDMDRIYPHGTSSGTEHMADCMADLMGAERSGVVDGQGYSAGYGGECTPAQSAAAAELIEGRLPS